MNCPICRSSLAVAGDYARCRRCDYWGSTLEHDVENTSAPDSEYELVSYEHTRRANYTAILELLAKRHPPGSRLLELGCADGLFLQMAQQRNGYRTLGIEPNEKMAAGNPHGQDVRRGFFPDVLRDLEGHAARFDIIALNCVFEHIPDLEGMIAAFRDHLRPGGSVMINVPVASGLMFKVSRALYRARIRYPFDRIWQKGFVSPHLHYFTTKSLTPLFERHGFSLTSERALAMFSLGGVYARLGLDPALGRAKRIALLAALYAYYPASLLAPDARAFVFSRGAG